MEKIDMFLSEEGRRATMELFLRLGNLSKNISEECYNKNGKNNKDSLTLQQFTCMHAIKYAGGECVLKEIAKMNCISKGALSIMLSKLEGRKYVEKYFSPDKDKRSACIRLTSLGENVLQRKEEETSFAIKKLYGDKLKDSDIDFLCEIYPKLLDMAKRLEGSCD